jgi:hypothetical protein
VELLAPFVIVDTGQLVPKPTTRGQPLTRMITIDDTMPFRRDVEVSLMSLHVFLALQIPILGLNPTSPVQGLNIDVMETDKSIVFPVAPRVADNL